MSVSTRDHEAVANRPRRRLQFSLRMLFVAVTLFALWLGDYVDPVRKLQRRLRDESQQVRLTAVYDLGRLGSENTSARSAIPAAFDDPSPLVREAAATAFSRAGGDWRTLTPLLNDAVAEVRLSAAEAMLWCGGDPNAVMPTVIRLAAQTSQSRAYSEPDVDGLIEAIGPETSAAVLPMLLKSLASDDAAIRSGAGGLLRSLPPPSASAVPDLIRLLDHRLPEIRLGAAEQLMRLGRNAAAAAPALERQMGDSEPSIARGAAAARCAVGYWKGDLPERLREGLSIDDVEQRRRTVKYLELLGRRASSASESLIKLFGDDHQDVRDSAADALFAIGPAAVEDLRTAVARSQNPTVRRRAAEVLGQLGPAARKAAPALLASLADPNEQVRLAAASALIAMGESRARAVAELRPLLRSNDKDTSLDALAAIYEIDAVDDPICEELYELVLSGNEDERRVAAGVLIRCGDRSKALLSALLAMIDGDGRSNYGAVVLIGEMGASAAPAVDRLVGLLSSDTAGGSSICFAVSQALAGIGPPAVPKLCEALHHPDPRARAMAARALGQIGPAAKDAVPLLIPRLDDYGEFHSVSGCIGSSTVVRDEAIEALGQIGPDARAAVRQLASMLIPATADGRFDYRNERVLRALGGIGADARSALPSILRLASLAKHELALPAALALTKIDPDHPQTLPRLRGVWREIEWFRSMEMAEAAEAVWRLGPRAAPLVDDLHRMVHTAPVLTVQRRCHAAYALAAFQAERPAALAYLNRVAASEDHVDRSVALELLGELTRRHEVRVDDLCE